MSYRRTHKRNPLTRKNHGQPMSEQQSIGPHGAAGSKAQGPLKNIYILPLHVTTALFQFQI